MKKLSILIAAMFILGMFSPAQSFMGELSEPWQQGESLTQSSRQLDQQPLMEQYGEQGAQQSRSKQMQGEGQGQQVAQLEVPEDLRGKNIVNRQGEDLGEIEDVVVDAQGNIRYIILSHGGFMGIGDELTPIPWQLVQNGQAARQDNLVVDLDKQTLENAPKFSADEQPNFEEPDYDQKVYGYYGIQPE